MHTQALAVRMDMVKAKDKAKIAELEQRDLSTSAEQLKVDAKELSGKIEQRIQEIMQSLEATTSSWMGIEKIDTIEAMHTQTFARLR